MVGLESRPSQEMLKCINLLYMKGQPLRSQRATVFTGKHLEVGTDLGDI